MSARVARVYVCHLCLFEYTHDLGYPHFMRCPSKSKGAIHAKPVDSNSFIAGYGLRLSEGELTYSPAHG